KCRQEYTDGPGFGQLRRLSVQEFQIWRTHEPAISLRVLQHLQSRELCQSGCEHIGHPSGGANYQHLHGQSGDPVRVASDILIVMNRSLVILSFGILGCLDAQTGWKAGAAKVKVTPTESIWLSGYGNRTKPSEGVLQDIFVKALAIQDGDGATSVIVTSDLQ